MKTEKSIHVLLLQNKLKTISGGEERFTYELVEQIEQNTDVRFTVLTTNHKEIMGSSIIRRVRYLEIPRMRLFNYFSRAFFFTIKGLFVRDVDIIQAHISDLALGSAGVWISKLRRKPLIVRVPGIRTEL